MTTTAPLAPGPIDSGARPTRHPGRWAAAALVLAVVLVVAVVVGSGDDQAPETARGPRLTPGSAMTLIEPRDGAPPDLVALVTQDDRRPPLPYRSLVRAGFDGEVRWRRLVDPEAAPVVVAAERGTVLLQELSDPVAEALTLTEPSDLVALDSDDGSVLWRTTVEAAGTPRIVDDRVLVPGEDGAVVALDLETGEEEWSLDDPANTSTEAPSIIEVGDGTVLVSRTRPDDGVALVPVAIEDGSEGPAHTPTCDGGAGDEERAFGFSDVRRVPETNDAVAVFGQAPQCVQRWDTTTGEPRWTTTTVPSTDDAGARAAFPRAVTLDEDHLAFDGAEGIVVVDLDDGTHRVLAGGGGSAPFAVVDGTVVTAVVDDDGVRPQVAGRAADGTGGWDEVHVGVEDATVLVTGSEGSIAQDASVLAEREDDVIRTISLDGVTGGEVATLDPATGESAVERVRLRPDPEAAGTQVWTTDIAGSWAVVVVTGLPHLVDVSSGEVVASWPSEV